MPMIMGFIAYFFTLILFGEGFENIAIVNGVFVAIMVARDQILDSIKENKK